MHNFKYSSITKVAFIFISFAVVSLFITNNTILKSSISYKENNLYNLNSAEIIMNTNYFEKRSFIPSKYFIEDYKKKYNIFTNTFDESFINISRRLKYKARVPLKTGEISVILYGIEKDKDYYIETLKNNTIEGNFFDDNTKLNSIAISMTLAKKLGLYVGDKIIIRLIGADNFYKAGEYEITAITENKNKYINDNIIFINIEELENMINKKSVASEVNISYLKIITNENIKQEINNIFKDDTKIYDREELYPYIKNYKEKINTLHIYINIALSIILFSSFLFLSSKYVFYYKSQKFLSLYLTSVFYTVLGTLSAFLLSQYLSKLFIKILNTDSIKYSFSVSYIWFLLINLLCITLADVLIYLYSEKNIKAK